MIETIRGIEAQTQYDFRETSCPDDPLKYLFEEWVPYYRLKYAIARALQPTRILEIGVRYGYSALAFLNACPNAEYVGIDLNVNAYGGNAGALSWARMQSSRFNASFLQEDSQKMTALPGGGYDLVHVDGQQDGIGTQHDLELALRSASWILLDGFLWTRTNCLHASDFLLRYKDLIEWSAILNGYAGDLLIKPKEEARRQPRAFTSTDLRNTYTVDYYTRDCGGYDSFKRTGGTILQEPRLRAVVALASSVKRETGRALDLGCGRGEASIALAKAGFQVTALDYSEDAIAIARQAAIAAGVAQQIQFFRADAASFDNSLRYDCAIAADLVEHMDPEELGRLYARVAGALTLSGCFVIHTFPNKWYYQYEYPRQLRAASSLGAFLPPQPRSRFELLMHINEQSPRELRRQLRTHFPKVLLWFAGSGNPVSNLVRRFSKAEMRAATDLYAVASHAGPDCTHFAESLSTRALPAGIEAGVSIQLLDSPRLVAPSSTFRVHVSVRSEDHELRSDPPYPVLLSSHWLRPDGTVLVFEGLRNELTPSLQAGDRQQYEVTVLAPITSGDFILRVTLLQERIRWFDAAGVYADIPMHVLQQS